MADTVERLITRVEVQGVGAAKAAMQDYRGSLTSVGGAMNALATGLMSMGAGYAMGRFVGGAVQGAMRMQRVTEQLNSSLKSNMGLSGAAAEEMRKFGASLAASSGKSMFGEEEIWGAQSMLSTFRYTKDQVTQMTPALLDMVEGYRKATGETMDLQQAAIMLGKAVQGNFGALRRFGIFVDEAAYKADPFNAVLKEIRREFGGQSAAAMNTAYGAMTQLSDAWGDWQKSLAVLVVQIMPPVLRFFSQIFNWLVALNEKTHGLSGAIGIFAIALGGISLMLYPLIASVRGLAAAWADVAGKATGAAAAQATAAGAGRFAGLGGLAGKVGPSALLALAGYGVGQIGANDRASGKSSLAAVTGGVGGGALYGASIGAMLGSVMPGVGNVVGGAVGGLAGAAYGGYQTVQELRQAQANPEEVKQTRLLEKIARLQEEQVRIVIGGGMRVESAVTRGDMQRAAFGILNSAVI